jgi:hypothetical protein
MVLNEKQTQENTEPFMAIDNPRKLGKLGAYQRDMQKGLPPLVFYTA